MSTTESTTNSAGVTVVTAKYNGTTAKVVVPGGFRRIRASVGWESSPGLQSPSNMTREQAQALVDALQAALDETGPR